MKEKHFSLINLSSLTIMALKRRQIVVVNFDSKNILFIPYLYEFGYGSVKATSWRGTNASIVKKAAIQLQALNKRLC